MADKVADIDNSISAISTKVTDIDSSLDKKKHLNITLFLNIHNLPMYLQIKTFQSVQCSWSNQYTGSSWA